MKKLYKLSDDPEYLNQTEPNDNSDYWIFFEVEGIIYRVKKMFDFMK